jgi:glyoxylase-like metal-dependent hydrolase (beta-lactamase superfamily II)
MRELEGDHSPLPGIELRVVHGHTTGMQMVVVHNADAGLLYSVDMFPTTAHLRPHYTPAYDNHPLASLEEKRVYLEELHGRGWDLIFGHDPYTPSARVTKGPRGEWELQKPA